MEMTTADYIGLLGGAAYLFAFAEVALGRWNGKSFWFEFNNLLGSVLLLYYALSKEAYVNVLLNLIWGGVALYSIQHIVHRHKHRSRIHISKSRRKAK